MAELAGSASAARRQPALAAPPVLWAGVAIQVLPDEARFSLRLPKAAAATAAEVAGFSLAVPVNRYAKNDQRWSARLGPNEWLLGGPEGDGGAIAAEIEAALAGQIHGVTDISHRQVAFDVAGAEAANILNAGCPLDLSLVGFPGGSATRSILGKAEIVLMRPASAPVFRVECWRSFAEYVHAFLAEAARDCPARE